MTRLIALLALALALCWTAPAFAHTRSESHSAWTIDGANVRMSFSVADVEAARITRDGTRPVDKALLGYLTPRLGVTAGGVACKPVGSPRMLSATAGFRRILVTEPGHPYVAAWWPAGHGLGYEHAFTHQVVDLVRGIADGVPPHPTFDDGLRVQRVLAAVETSADTRTWQEIPRD